MGDTALACAVLLAGTATSMANAASVTYYFSGNVSSSECGPACGSPTVTGDGAIGTRFFGQYTFDSDWTPSSFSTPGASAVYVSDINSSLYAAQIQLNGVGFSFHGLALETQGAAYDVYNNFPGNQLGNGDGTGTGNGQPLSYGYWLLELRKLSDAGFFVPLSPAPLLSDFSTTMLVLAAYEQGVVYDGTDGIGRIYRGNIDYLSDIPYSSVTATPIPPALPLFGTGLGFMGLVGWWRKRRAETAA